VRKNVPEREREREKESASEPMRPTRKSGNSVVARPRIGYTSHDIPPVRVQFPGNACNAGKRRDGGEGWDGVEGRGTGRAEGAQPSRWPPIKR